MPNNPWTKEEINLLIAKKKVPTRSRKSSLRKLVQLGLRKPKYKMKNHKKTLWTEEEIQLLKENKKIPNRSKDSIRGMKIRLGLVKPIKNLKRPWKKTEEKLLKNLVKQGKSAREIFLMKVFPKYSRNSIQKKMCYLGLAKKQPKQVWTKDEVNRFRDFLKENWEGKTPKDLIDLWNSTSTKKVKKSKVLYHLYNLKIKIPYGEVSRINKLRKKESSIKTQIFKNTKLLEESLRLARATVMRRRILQGRDIWTGMPVSEELNQEILENV